MHIGTDNCMDEDNKNIDDNNSPHVRACVWQKHEQKHELEKNAKMSIPVGKLNSYMTPNYSLCRKRHCSRTRLNVIVATAKRKLLHSFNICYFENWIQGLRTMSNCWSSRAILDHDNSQYEWKKPHQMTRHRKLALVGTEKALREAGWRSVIMQRLSCQGSRTVDENVNTATPDRRSKTTH